MTATSPLPSGFEPGSAFGEYTIVRRIGRGGQGSVYEVTDRLGLSWALKVSDEMDLSDPQAEMRFAREARCVAENLSEIPRNVGILIGEHYGVWARRFYIKMKLLQGESLAQRLRRIGQLSVYEAVKLFERVAFAVGHAHRHGVLHRDLKPENIFITTREEVVVLDWGCLQLIEAGQARTTLNGVICTPGYAPIEQYLVTSIATLTPAADIYALGVMFYEALAGYHPFLNWSRAALNHERPKAVAPLLPPEPETRSVKCTVETQTVVVPTTMLRQLQAQLHGEPDERSASVFTHGKTVKSNASTPPASIDTAHSWAPSTSGDPLGTMNTWGRTGATYQLPDSFALPKPESHSSAPPTRTIKPLAVAAASAPHEKLAAAVPQPAKRDAPRRFSIVQVLALQENTVPQPISGIPVGLRQLLSSMLTKRADARPQDALVLAHHLRTLLDGELKESPEVFAVSTPEQHGKYLARALWWTRFRQSSSRLGYAAAGFVLSALTGVASYYGMSLTNAEPERTSVRPLSVAASAQHSGVAGSTAATGEITPAVVDEPAEAQARAASVAVSAEVLEPGVPTRGAVAIESEPELQPVAKQRVLARKDAARKRLTQGSATNAAAGAASVNPVASATVSPAIPGSETLSLQAPVARSRRLRSSPQARLPSSPTRRHVLTAEVHAEGVAP